MRIAEVAKAVAGFVVGVGSAIVTRITTEGGVFPAIDPFDWKGWVVFLVIGVLAYLGVYIPPNALSMEQISKGLVALPAVERSKLVARHFPPEG
jgi:hypothetical protein